MKTTLTFVALALSTAVHAQVTFTEVTGTSFTGVSFGSSAFSDVDGDGDQDVLLTGALINDDLVTKLYTNDGAGNFTEVTGTPFIGIVDSEVAFADVDVDGDEDLLITGSSSANDLSCKLYKNDGSGNFSEVSGTPFIPVNFSSLAFADVDNDGDLDLLITGRDDSTDPTSTLYNNDGSGNFSLVNGTPFEAVSSSSIAFADVDGDSDLDVLITGRNELSNPVSNLYTNDGSGNFTEVNGTPFTAVLGSSCAFADVDSDGDQDVLIAGEDDNFFRITKLYTNDGSGNFTEVNGTPFTGISSGSIHFVDVQVDGDPDVLITGLNPMFMRVIELYINDGSGNFTEVNGTPFQTGGAMSTAFGDIEGDGDPDLLIANRDTLFNPVIKLYRNETIPLSVAETVGDAMTIAVYPNPTTDQLNWTSINTQTVQVFDQTGRLVFTKLQPNGTLDISALPNGIYTVQLQTDTTVHTAKVVKQ